MKKLTLVFTGIVSFFLICMTTQAAVFDDFSDTELDLFKWKLGERAITVEDGKVLLQGRANWYTTQTVHMIHLPFINIPHKIQTTLAVNSQLDTSSGSLHRFGGGIRGTFYGTDDDSDIIYIHHRGIEAYINVECNPPFASMDACHVKYGLETNEVLPYPIAEGVFSPTFAVGEEVTIGLEFDGNHTFTFTMAGQEDVIIVGPTEGSTPPYSRGAGLHGYLIARSSSPGINGTNMAYFDDVQASGGLLTVPINDSFDQPILNSANWKDYSWRSSRRLTDGSMELSLRDIGEGQKQIDSGLYAKFHRNFFQADVTLDSSSSMSGTTSNDRLEVYFGGWVFDTIKDGSSYPGYRGKGGADLILEQRGDGTPLRVIASIWSQLANGDQSPYNINEILDCDVQFDIPVTLSIQRNDTGFTFTCNGTRRAITSPFPMYESPWRDERRILVTTQKSDVVEEAYIKAYIDNVYIERPSSFGVYLPAIFTAAKQQRQQQQKSRYSSSYDKPKIGPTVLNPGQ